MIFCVCVQVLYLKIDSKVIFAVGIVWPKLDKDSQHD